MAKPSWTAKGTWWIIGTAKIQGRTEPYIPREEERPPRMTDGGGKTLGTILPFPLPLSLFSPLLFFYPEYEKLWIKPKGLGGGYKRPPRVL